MLRPFQGVWPRVHPDAYVSEFAYVVGDVEVHANASIWPGTVVRGDMGRIVIGENTCIQDNSTVHADRDCWIGPNAAIGHNVLCHADRVGGVRPHRQRRHRQRRRHRRLLHRRQRRRGPGGNEGPCPLHGHGHAGAGPRQARGTPHPAHQGRAAGTTWRRAGSTGRSRRSSPPYIRSGGGHPHEAQASPQRHLCRLHQLEPGPRQRGVVGEHPLPVVENVEGRRQVQRVVRQVVRLLGSGHGVHQLWQGQHAANQAHLLRLGEGLDGGVFHRDPLLLGVAKDSGDACMGVLDVVDGVLLRLAGRQVQVELHVGVGW